MDSDIGKNMDRISKLPDHLRLRILSLLPTKYAVGTSILSKRWQYLWTFVPIIDIDEWQTFQDINHLSPDRQNEVDLSFQEFVTNVLFLSKAKKIQKFRLKISSPEITYNDVESWISDAIKRKVQNLEFLNMYRTIALPKKLFNSKTLVILRLYGAFLDVPRLVRLHSLKILELHGVEYGKEDSLRKLLFGCPILEELDIMRCARDLSEVVNVSVPTLRRLKVDFDMDSDNDYGSDLGFEPDDRNCKFVVDAPQLEHLDIKNYVAGKHMFRNLSSLSNASLLVQPNRFIDYGPRMYKLLSGIPNVKYLDAFFSFETDVNHVMLPTFHNLIQLSFGANNACSWKFGANKSTLNLKLLADLLLCSPKLEVLILKGNRRDESTKSWNPPQQVPICLLLCLKEIQINEFSGKDYELELIEYLLKNCKVLKMMTIDRKYLDDSVIGKLAAFPKGSKACQLNLVCNSRQQAKVNHCVDAANLVKWNVPGVQKPQLSSSGENDVRLPLRGFKKKMSYQNTSSRGVWKYEQEMFLISLMTEFVQENVAARRSTVWMPQIWAKCAKKMFARFGLPYTGDQVSQKYQRMKLQFNTFKALKDTSGLGWDDEAKKVIADEAFWAKAPARQRKYRNKGFPLYDQLAFILKSTQATGDFSMPSTHPPAMSDEEGETDDDQEVEDDDCHTQQLDDTHPYTPNMANIENILLNQHRAANKRRHGKSGRSHSKKSKSGPDAVYSVLELMSKASVVRTRVETARLNWILQKGKGPVAGEVCSDDPYHPNIAQDQMCALKDHLVGMQYAAGIAKLSDSYWRTAFIRSPDELKLQMLQALCPAPSQRQQHRPSYPPWPYPFPQWQPPYPPDYSSGIPPPFPYHFPTSHPPPFTPQFPPWPYPFPQWQPQYPPDYSSGIPPPFPYHFPTSHPPPFTPQFPPDFNAPDPYRPYPCYMFSFHY